jgi:hypothetical protein
MQQPIPKRISSFFRTLAIFLATLPKGLPGIEKRLTEARSKLEKLEASANSTKTDMLFQTVGRALTAWAKMEENIVIVAALLLGVRPARAGLIMYSILNFHSWLSLINDLFATDDVFSQKTKTRWNKLSERLRAGLKDKRDQLAHHSVRMAPASGEDSSVMSSVLDTRQKTRKQRPLDLSEIMIFTDSVLSLAEDLATLIEAMKAEREAFLKTPRH